MSSAGNLIVTTNYGKVLGKERTSCVGDTFISFQGIPFAKPPVGELRFKDPEPPQTFEDVWDATKEKPGCLAFNSWHGKYDGSEDCLYLNIYVKNLNPSKPYPVMFYIYGGESSLYLEFLVINNKNVVISNYRGIQIGFWNGTALWTRLLANARRNSGNFQLSSWTVG